MSPEENKALVTHVIETGLNGRRLDVADECFSDDYVVHLPGHPDGSMPRGPEAFKRVIGAWHTACSDWHMTIEQMVADEEFVANRFTTRATHDGSLFGVPATHESFVVNGMEFHRLEDGKVAETWVSDDLPGIFVQLGLIDMRAILQSDRPA